MDPRMHDEYHYPNTDSIARAIADARASNLRCAMAHTTARRSPLS